MSKYTFNECRAIAKEIELQSMKCTGGYRVYESGTRFEKFFPSLDEMSKWLLIQQKKYHKEKDIERRNKDSWNEIWNKQFDKRGINLHFDTTSDKTKVKK